MLPILCLDFDGVLHSYTSGWKGADVIPDPPVPGAMDFLFAAHEQFNIAIHSSRFRYEGGIEAVKRWLITNGVEPGYLTDQIDFDHWENGAIVLCKEKPPAFVTIDDRALTFTGVWPSIETLLAFKPWNKQKV